jgi:hypothetical protein
MMSVVVSGRVLPLADANGDSLVRGLGDEAKREGSNRPYLPTFTTNFRLFDCHRDKDLKLEPFGLRIQREPQLDIDQNELPRDSQKIVIEDEGWRLVSSNDAPCQFGSLLYQYAVVLELDAIGGKTCVGWLPQSSFRRSEAMLVYAAEVHCGQLLPGEYLWFHWVPPRDIVIIRLLLLRQYTRMERNMYAMVVLFFSSISGSTRSLDWLCYVGGTYVDVRCSTILSLLFVALLA